VNRETNFFDVDASPSPPSLELTSMVCQDVKDVTLPVIGDLPPDVERKPRKTSK
jgi:hypothetical protein